MPSHENTRPESFDAEPQEYTQALTAGLDLSAGPAVSGEGMVKFPGGGLTESITGLEGYVNGIVGLGQLSVKTSLSGPQPDIRR